MRFLLIYDNLRTGGIETLIIRMSNWLVENNHEVNILLKNKNINETLLNDKINISYYKNRTIFIYLPNLNKIYLGINAIFKNTNIILAFDAPSYWIASLIQKNCVNNKPLLFLHICHPLDFTPFFYSKFQAKQFNKLLNSLNDESLIFMNAATKEAFTNRLGREFYNSAIHPLAVDEKKYINLDRHPSKYKIISVGRIVNFKTYNFLMVDVIKNIVKKGYNVTYEIYGNGAQFDQLNEKIQNEGMSQFIKLKGEISYSSLYSIFNSAYIFIGMGTSLIEAAMAKVPCIVAIINQEKPVSYGYFYEQSGFNCGEFEMNKKEYLIQELIENLLKMDENQYAIESQKNHDFSMLYSIENIMKNKIKLFENEISMKRNVNHMGTMIYRKYFYLYILPNDLLHFNKTKFLIRNLIKRTYLFNLLTQ